MIRLALAMNDDLLRRAKTYPYRIPERSYLLANGRQETAENFSLPELSCRRPVLACGCNQSPERLALKFANIDGGPIPVIRVWLQDYDVVYSAHFTAYGSIPATLQYSPGTTVFLFVAWLTAGEQNRLHQTESVGLNYDFGRLDGIEMGMDGGAVLDRVFVYLSRRGCLLQNDAPIALAAIKAEGRKWPALTEEQILGLARDYLEPGVPLDDFILAALADEDLRRARGDALEKHERPFAHPAFTCIAV